MIIPNLNKPDCKNDINLHSQKIIIADKDVLTDRAGNVNVKVIKSNHKQGRFIIDSAVVYGKKDNIKFSELGDKW